MIFLAGLLRVVVSQQYFDQKLDHFDLGSSNGTFKQRYFVNDGVYREGGPGFLHIGGESPIGRYAVDQGLAYDLAREHGGILYALEHRYYGESLPFRDLSLDNLKYLSSGQALEDLAYFTKQVRKPNQKWFLIGGSYPGNLAAWAHQKYPKVFYGALASSAPVEAKSDFQEYDAMVGQALGPKCHAVVNQMVESLDDLYSKGMLDSVKQQLGCSQVKDDILFLYTIADSLANIVQNNDPTESPNINELCSEVALPGDGPAKLKRFLDVLVSFFKRQRTTCSAFTGIDDLLKLTVTKGSFFRQWTYQSCMEFGYWQTASKHPTRSKHLTVDWFNDFYCRPPFFSQPIGPPNVKETNRKYHGKLINGNNILFTNGQHDPWFALSTENGIVITNASHVNDLMPESPSDSPALVQARLQIRRTFRDWINA